MDKNKFINTFKKSQLILKGHKIEMYGNSYSVMDTNDRFTLLSDSNGAPVAFSTNKLKKILGTMHKSVVMDKNPAIIQGSDKGTSERTKEGAGIGSAPGKMHGGKIRVDKTDKNGKKYHYWVDAQHGTKHDDHKDEKPSEHQIDEASKKIHGEMLSVINLNAHDSDKPKLKKLLDDWVQSKAEYHNLKEAHTQLGKEQGGYHPTSTLNNIANKQSAHEEKFTKLKDALVASKKKVLAEG
jgi:hypothetical protein